MKNVQWILISYFLIVLTASSFLFSDGETRKATQKEKDFYKEVITTLSESLPKCPEGWTEQKDQIEELTNVGKGSEKNPLRIFYHVEWNDLKRKQEADDATQNALIPIMNNSVRNAEIQKISMENDKIIKEYGEAISKNDQLKAKQLSEKIEIQSKKMSIITDAQDREMDSTMEKMSAHDVHAAINYSVNLFSEWTNNSIIPNGQIAGYPSFKTKGEWTKENGWVEEATYIVLGKEAHINTNGGHYIEVKEQTDIPSTKVQSIIVKVQADPQRSKQIIEKIDWNILSKLLKR